jgi:hypothetical protein
MATFVHNIVNIGQVLKLETRMNVNTEKGASILETNLKLK